MKTNNILICVTGLTPQIVTETLFCLAVKEKIQIDEVYVITTKLGREVILGKDKLPHTPKIPLKTEIANLCSSYKLNKPKFENNDTHIIGAKEESIELNDIRSDKDNILFPNKVCEFIREKTQHPNNVLYCAITGGRKSMSVHLANVVSIFARENDRLVHVLTREEHEFKGFYPTNKKEINDLELADIPFVKLRSLLSHEIKGDKLFNQKFDQIVGYTQKQLKFFSEQNKLVLDSEKREISYHHDSISLEPVEFILYYFFVEQKQQRVNKISIHDIISIKTSQKLLEYFHEFFPNYHMNEKIFKKWQQKGLDAGDFRSKRSKINSKVSELIKDADIASQFIIDVERVYSDSKYFIPAPKNRFKLIVV